MKRKLLLRGLVAAALLLGMQLSSGAQTITKTFRSVPLKEVFMEIEAQTGLSVMYDSQEIDKERKVSAKFSATPVKEALRTLLGKDITISEKDKMIVLYRAQEAAVAISGTVKDDEGNPVIGCAVLLQGTTEGTTTDFDGKYTISARPSDILEFSSLSMKTVAEKVGSRKVIDVTLHEDSDLLSESIVVGYGTARKGDLTGPISSIVGSALEQRSTGQLSMALQGQIAGVQVTRSSGAPGATATIRVRGMTTMSDNDPLVVVDGVPSSMDAVDASQIETMTLLKDASSAAIYGSRAAAGVILITTKSARDGQFSADYSYEYSIDVPTAKPEVGSVIDYLNVMNEFKWNDGAAEQYNQYSQSYIENYMDMNAIDPFHYPNTDWVGLLLKDRTHHSKHTVSLAGGGKDVKTKFTFSYFDQDGWYTANNKNYGRYSARLNNDFNIRKWLKATLNIDFTNAKTTSPSFGNVITGAYRAPAMYPAKWENGNYADVKDGSNYYAALVEGGQHFTDSYRFGGKAQVDITPVKNLVISAAVAPRLHFTYKKNFDKQVPTYYEDGKVVYQQSFMSTSLSEVRNISSSMTYQFFANYSNTWGNHYLSGMVGYEGYSYEWENLGASRLGYILKTFPYLNVGPEDMQYNSGNAGHNAYQSGFGRLMYSYKNRYIAQVNFRADASSRFAKGNRTGYFPSASAGWVLSEEPWFSVPQINYFKLRASVGQLGNERIGSEFPYLAQMTFGTSVLYDKGQNAVVPISSAAQYVYAFENISWETTTTYDLGFDINLFNSRLSFTADAYHKKTEDMLLVLGFPQYSGFSAPEQNAGDMYTNGWEIDLKWRDRIGDFSYGISANLSDYRSRMGYMGDKRTVSGNKIIEEGSYYNEWYIYRTNGLIQTEADMYDEFGKKPTLTANDQPGCINYIDWNGDGKINADDKVKMGNSLPEYIYGGSLDMGWRNFDFSLQFQGVGHQRVMFNTAWIEAPQGQWGNVPALVLGKYWSRANTPEENLKAEYPLLTYQNRTNTQAGSDFWLFNGAYFRLKNITLGYTVPENFTKKFFVQHLRIYASAQDLPAISRFPRGWDPEITSFGNDYIATSFIFGASVRF